MTKKRIEIVATGALILIFLFAWGNTFKIIKKRAGNNLTPLATNNPFVISDISDKPGRDNDADKGPVWGRCPFSGKTYFYDEEMIGLRLTGIMGGKKTSMAIINDDIVKIGDKIGAVTVVDIKQDRVILNDGSRDIELILKQ